MINVVTGGNIFSLSLIYFPIAVFHERGREILEKNLFLIEERWKNKRESREHNRIPDEIGKKMLINQACMGVAKQ